MIHHFGLAILRSESPNPLNLLPRKNPKRGKGEGGKSKGFSNVILKNKRAAGEKKGYFEGLNINPVFGNFPGRTPPPGVGGGVRILSV